MWWESVNYFVRTFPDESYQSYSQIFMNTWIWGYYERFYDVTYVTLTFVFWEQSNKRLQVYAWRKFGSCIKYDVSYFTSFVFLLSPLLRDCQ